MSDIYKAGLVTLGLASSGVQQNGASSGFRPTIREPVGKRET